VCPKPATLAMLQDTMNDDRSVLSHESMEDLDHITFYEKILSIMHPPTAILRSAREFTHLRVDHNSAPISLTSIRDAIQVLGPIVFGDEDSATHILHIIGVNYDFQGFFIHDIVVAVQSRLLWDLVTYNTDRKTESDSYVRNLARNRLENGCKPKLLVKNIPHIPSFSILVEWMYRHNEKELYHTLSAEGDEMLLGFAQNCNFWGIIDSKLSRVIMLLVKNRVRRFGRFDHGEGYAGILWLLPEVVADESEDSGREGG